MAETTARQSLADLPDDVRAIIAPHMDEDEATLASIGRAIATKRDEAKAARSGSGIEANWHAAEEAYIGIDDANRHEFADAKWAKPMSADGPVTTSREPNGPALKSTAYVRITARYVDAGSAKVSEILLPPDDKAFSFSEMPVPELIRAKEDRSQVYHEGLGMPLTRPLQPGEIPPPGPVGATGTAQPVGPVTPLATATAPTAQAPAQPGAAAPAAPWQPPVPPGHVPLTVGDLALEAIEIARKKAKRAETRIYDWMVACQYTAQMRKMVFDSARIGSGVLKGPFPKPSKGFAVLKSEGGKGITLAIRTDVSPAVAWVDPWNIFPDPACGEDIHDGDYIFERDFFSARQVRDLKKIPGYIASQIDKVLEEGPQKAGASDARAPGERHTKGRYEIWYYYGTMQRDDMNTLNAAAGKPAETGDKDQVYAIVTMINDSPVRASINPLDSGSFPYHVLPWQRRAGHWAGIGVGEQLKMPQATTNAATRALLNNAGNSAGSQFIIDRTLLYPMDGNWTITPDKLWGTTDDGAGQDVRAMFAAVQIPNVTEPLMRIVQYGMQLAEEATSIPLVTQGQSGETTPDTFGATQLQQTNANQLLRAIGYSADDRVTEPVVRQFHEWLLLDPDVPDEEKGDFQINAHGSIALVERAIQDQTITQIGPLTVNPNFGGDPKKWFKQMLKSKRLDPQDFTFSEEQQAKIDAAPPPEAPAVTVAKIGADTAMKQLAAKQTAEERSDANEAQIAAAANELEGAHVQNDAQRIQAEQHRTLADATVKLHEIQMRHDLAMLDYANKRGISLDRVKADLAKTAMTLQTQRALNTEDNAHDARQNRPPKPRRGERPPGQVPGKAGNGRAFEQGPPA